MAAKKIRLSDRKPKALHLEKMQIPFLSQKRQKKVFLAAPPPCMHAKTYLKIVFCLKIKILSIAYTGHTGFQYAFNG